MTVRKTTADFFKLKKKKYYLPKLNQKGLDNNLMKNILSQSPLFILPLKT